MGMFRKDGKKTKERKSLGRCRALRRMLKITLRDGGKIRGQRGNQQKVEYPGQLKGCQEGERDYSSKKNKKL